MNQTIQILTQEQLASAAQRLIRKRGKLIKWEIQITDTRRDDTVNTQLALVAYYTDRADNTVKTAWGGL